MNKYIKNTFLSGMAVALFACTSCSDTWDDHYDTNSSGMAAQKSIWEAISSDEQLKDFREVIERVGRTDLLKSDQMYTVWAPVNDSFNKDSIISLIENGQTLDVIKRFVNNHITRSAYSNMRLAQSVNMLNKKRCDIDGTGYISDAKIVSLDPLKCNNGLLYTVHGELPFRNNIFEALEVNEDFSKIYEFFYRYEEDSLDEGKSVSRGVDENGNKIWVDSVIISNNPLFNSLSAIINVEDSNYWALLPHNDAFEKRLEETLPYFDFHPSVENRDSLQQLYATRYMLSDCFFNMNDNKYYEEGDSLASTTYSKREPLYDVFHHPFYTRNDTVGILENYTEEITCSNGTLYGFDEWPFSIYDSFFRRMKIECERSGNIETSSTYMKNAQYQGYYTNTDSISNGFLDVVPTSSAVNPTMTFKIPNTLAGEYDIYVVAVPKSAMSIYNTDYRPYKFRASIIERDPDDDKGAKWISEPLNDNKEITNNPYVMDTLYVGTHKFNHCYYAQPEVGVMLQLTSFIRSAETSEYSREMLLDFILLKPHRETESDSIDIDE